MSLVLSSENAIAFLIEHQLCPPSFQCDIPVRRLEGTNFNLVIRSVGGQSLLVKQNRINSQGASSPSFRAEWGVQEMIDKFDLTVIQPLVSQVILLDSLNQILVSVFFDNYTSLDRLYSNYRKFPPQLAKVMGANLAKIHLATYQQRERYEFVSQYLKQESDWLPGFVRRLNSLDPSLFARVCPDGLNFYRLYQRFPSLNQSVLELYAQIQPSCTIHNDLTLDNFIVDRQLNLDSPQIESHQIKIIDWERAKWGDPAVDLGMVVAEYVGGIWLGNLIVDRELDIATILRLATFPLETFIPSLRAFIQSYLRQFPQIVVHRPNFIQRVVQFAGMGILDRLSYYVEHHYPFNNNSICKLQVAKNLICDPQESIATVFGATEADLLQLASIQP